MMQIAKELLSNVNDICSDLTHGEIGFDAAAASLSRVVYSFQQAATPQQFRAAFLYRFDSIETPGEFNDAVGRLRGALHEQVYPRAKPARSIFSLRLFG